MITISIILGIAFMLSTLLVFLVTEEDVCLSPIVGFCCRMNTGGVQMLTLLMLLPFICGVIILFDSLIKLEEINKAPITYNACYQFHELR